MLNGVQRKKVGGHGYYCNGLMLALLYYCSDL